MVSKLRCWIIGVFTVAIAASFLVHSLSKAVEPPDSTASNDEPLRALQRGANQPGDYAPPSVSDKFRPLSSEIRHERAQIGQPARVAGGSLELPSHPNDNGAGASVYGTPQTFSATSGYQPTTSPSTTSPSPTSPSPNTPQGYPPTYSPYAPSAGHQAVPPPVASAYPSAGDLPTYYNGHGSGHGSCPSCSPSYPFAGQPALVPYGPYQVAAAPTASTQTWERRVGPCISRLSGVGDNLLRGELVTAEYQVRYTAEYSTTQDSVMYGVLQSVQIQATTATVDPGNQQDDRDLMKLERLANRLIDQPFSARVREDGDQLVIKDVKFAGFDLDPDDESPASTIMQTVLVGAYEIAHETPPSSTNTFRLSSPDNPACQSCAPAAISTPVHSLPLRVLQAVTPLTPIRLVPFYEMPAAATLQQETQSSTPRY